MLAVSNQICNFPDILGGDPRVSGKFTCGLHGIDPRYHGSEHISHHIALARVSTKFMVPDDKHDASGRE